MKHSSIKLLCAALIVSGQAYSTEKSSFEQAYHAERNSLSPAAVQLLNAIKKNDRASAQQAAHNGAYICEEPYSGTHKRRQNGLPFHHIMISLSRRSQGINIWRSIAKRSNYSYRVTQEATDLDNLTKDLIRNFGGNPELIDATTLRSIGLCSANIEIQKSPEKSIEEVGERLGDMFTFFGKLASVNTQ